MPRIRQYDRYFSEGLTSNPLARLEQETIVTTHTAVTPQNLDLRAYRSKKVEVESTTLTALRIADRTHQEVKCLLPYGSGNRKAEVIYTEGESWAREKIQHSLAMAHANESLYEKSKRVLAFQAGNCGEHAALAYALLARQRIAAPVRYVADLHKDHGYVTIGDSRDRRWGEKNTVVVDAWVSHPSACTLAHAKYDGTGMTAFERSVNEPPHPDAEINDVHHVGSDAVSSLLFASGHPPIGTRLLSHLFESKRHTLVMNPTKTVAQDPSTRYTDNRATNGDTMDHIALCTVQRQRAAEDDCQTSSYR